MGGSGIHDRHTGASPQAVIVKERPMAVRVDLNISLDGFATTTDQTPENHFGHDWARLVEAYVATRTFRARVLHDIEQGVVSPDTARSVYGYRDSLAAD